MSPSYITELHMFFVCLYTGDYHDSPDDNENGALTYNANVFALAEIHNVPSVLLKAKTNYYSWVNYPSVFDWQTMADFVLSARHLFRLSGSEGRAMQEFWMTCFRHYRLGTWQRDEVGLEAVEEALEEVEDEVPEFEHQLDEAFRFTTSSMLDG